MRYNIKKNTRRCSGEFETGDATTRTQQKTDINQGTPARARSRPQRAGGVAAGITAEDQDSFTGSDSAYNLSNSPSLSMRELVTPQMSLTATNSPSPNFWVR